MTIQLKEIRPMVRPYIGIEGPIGVGKTTLANYLSQRLRAEIMLEVFEENPFLEKFYENRECYALQTQLFFLMSRYRQHEKLSNTEQILVSDYIFAKNDLFARYTLTGEEFTLYGHISGALAANLPTPSLVVVLRAELAVLMERIHKRGREYEQGESMQSYMENLVDQYDLFFAGYKDAPVMVIDTTQINIINDEVARNDLLDKVVKRFKDVLAERPTQVPLL